jgi:hypothetical protein
VLACKLLWGFGNHDCVKAQTVGVLACQNAPEYQRPDRPLAG